MHTPRQAGLPRCRLIFFQDRNIDGLLSLRHFHHDTAPAADIVWFMRLCSRVPRDMGLIVAEGLQSARRTSTILSLWLVADRPGHRFLLAAD